MTDKCNPRSMPADLHRNMCSGLFTLTNTHTMATHSKGIHYQRPNACLLCTQGLLLWGWGHWGRPGEEPVHSIWSTGGEIRGGRWSRVVMQTQSVSLVAEGCSNTHILYAVCLKQRPAKNSIVLTAETHSCLRWKEAQVATRTPQKQPLPAPEYYPATLPDGPHTATKGPATKLN